MIQFSTVTILYWGSTNLSDGQFLYSDLVMVFPLSFAMCFSKEAESLHFEKPVSDLISKKVITSVLSMIFICVATQVLVYINLLDQVWFKDFKTLHEKALKEDPDQRLPCYESTVKLNIINFF